MIQQRHLDTEGREASPTIGWMPSLAAESSRASFLCPTREQGLGNLIRIAFSRSVPSAIDFFMTCFVIGNHQAITIEHT